ncbi:uncharacterized protein LOC101457596 [Ceratitis capitata]|uniref:uncharacterized protein LOC101457596 n=1 Tax=Ceratitis capitata TaxID=7213 RepID=UPI0003297D5B|nr:uncharacterized protein LOC101457596 [Ceratitis capitata]
MAPWNWRNPCTSASTDSDDSNQTPPPRRKHKENELNKSSLHSENGGKMYSNFTNNIYQNPKTNATTKFTTPILFSTNRGLHLRVAKPISKSNVDSAASVYGNFAGAKGGDLPSGVDDISLSASSDYEINFCDLERWSTNRANTICLEDTFIVSRRNNSLPSPNLSPVDNNCGINRKMQRSGSIFCVPSGSRHALVMPQRSLYQRSTSIQSSFERFGLQ